MALREPGRQSHRRTEVAKDLVVVHDALGNRNGAVFQSPTREPLAKHQEIVDSLAPGTSLAAETQT